MVRKPSPYGRKGIGTVPSLKMKTMVWYESSLEMDFIYRLEFDGDVKRYRAQPRRYKFSAAGWKMRYTPDFHVVRRSRTRQVVEVKYEDDAKDADFLAKVEFMRPHIEKTGEEFVVVTEKEIRVQPLLNNIKILHKYSRTLIPETAQFALHDFLASRGRATVRELEASLASKGVTRQIIYALMYWKILATDLNSQLGPDALVTFTEALYEKCA